MAAGEVKEISEEGREECHCQEMVEHYYNAECRALSSRSIGRSRLVSWQVWLLLRRLLH